MQSVAACRDGAYEDTCDGQEGGRDGAADACDYTPYRKQDEYLCTCSYVATSGPRTSATWGSRVEVTHDGVGEVAVHVESPVGDVRRVRGVVVGEVVVVTWSTVYVASCARLRGMWGGVDSVNAPLAAGAAPWGVRGRAWITVKRVVMHPR